MNINKFASTPAGQITIIAAVGVFVLYYGERKARKVVNAINPVNDENIFYQGTNAVGAKITGRDNFDLGHFIYDLIHGS